MAAFRWAMAYLFKDFKNNKGRYLLGILAIAISASILVGVNGVVDRLEYSFVDVITNFTDEIDLQVESTESQWINNSMKLIEKIETVDGIDGATSRLVLTGYISSGKGDISIIPVTIIAMDLEKERELEIGVLDPDVESLKENEILLVGKAFGESTLDAIGGVPPVLKYSFGGKNYSLEVNVKDVVEQNRKFSAFVTNPVIMNIKTLWTIIGEDLSTTIIAQFKNHDEFYSVSASEESYINALKIATNVQKVIGLDYKIEIPIASSLRNASSTLMYFRMIFNFLGYVTVFVAGVLIYSLMTTNVEDKAYDFAIMRVAGSKKSFIIILNLLQVVIQATIGLIIGVIISMGVISFFENVILGQMLNISEEARASFQGSLINFSPLTLLYGILVILVATLASGYSPIKNSINKDIIKTLEGVRETTKVKLMRERATEKNLIIVGFALSAVGISIFILFPMLDLMNNITLNVLFFLAFFYMFMIGLVLIAIGGIEPFFEKLLAKLLKSTHKKVGYVTDMLLKRNRRRNNLTSIAFAVTMAFMLFLSINTALDHEMTLQAVHRILGSDIIVFGIGNETSIGTIPMELIEELQNDSRVAGISYVSYEGIYLKTGAFLRVGDLAMIESYYPSVYTISENFTSGLFSEYSYEGDDAFQKINENGTVIISRSLARAWKLSIGSFIRLDVEASVDSVDELYRKSVELEVVGIVDRLPGFENMRQNPNLYKSTPLLIGNKTLQFLTRANTTSPYYVENVTTNGLYLRDYISRLYIKMGNIVTATQLATELNQKYQGKIFALPSELIEQFIARSQETSDILMVAVLFFALVIAMLSVVLSTHATVIELKKEIGILKAIGLNDDDVTQVFVFHSFIITFASTFLGIVIGYLIAYISHLQDAINSEYVLPFVKPTPLVIAIYLFTLILSSVVSIFPTRYITKRNIIEILKTE